MKKFAIFFVLALASSVPSAQAADCGAVVDELMKAVSGHVTMSADKKASMLRMTTMSYDYCMAGDTKRSGEIRDMLMTQLREHLGGTR